MGTDLEDIIRTMHGEVRSREAGATKTVSVMVNGRKCELRAKVEKTWFGLGTRTRFTLTPMDNRECQVEEYRTEFIYNKGKGIGKAIKEAEEEINMLKSDEDVFAEESSDDDFGGRCLTSEEFLSALDSPSSPRPTASSTQASAEASQASSEPPVLSTEVSNYISQIDKFIKQEIPSNELTGFFQGIFTFLNKTEKFVSGKHFSMPGKHLSKAEAMSLRQKLKELYNAKIINHGGYKFSIQEVAVAKENVESMGDFLAKTRSLETLLLLRILSFSEVF
jgi:hypothetical protein